MAYAWTEQQLQQPEFVRLNIASNVTRHTVEKRYRRDLRIDELKCKLELVTGCDWRHVRLELFTEEDEPVVTIDRNDAALGDYPVADGMRLQCTDPTKRLGHYDSPADEAAEEGVNYEMSYEEYLSRPNTFLQWMKTNKLGRFKERDPEEERRRREAREAAVAAEARAAAAMHAGDRCEVALNDTKRGVGRARGTVMYVGETRFEAGKWVGVRLDEPFGSSNGDEYFDCEQKYGVFVRPANVMVGDFPELGIDDLDEI